jgi:hypothetical protein
VAELFTLRFEVGAEAPLSLIAQMVDDVSTLGEGAMDLAVLATETQARRYLSDLVASEGLRSLVAQARRHQLGISEGFEDEVEYLDAATRELDMFIMRRPSKRYRYSALASAVFAPTWGGSQWVSSTFEPVIQRLVAAETATRLPRSGYRVRSLTYSNPTVMELITVASATAASLAYLLRVLVTLGPRRRRENSRADAEERIQDAHARDVEDEVSRRLELRALLMDGIRSGEVELQPGDINDALLNKIVGAADRLADREPRFDREELPA